MQMVYLMHGRLLRNLKFISNNTINIGNFYNNLIFIIKSIINKGDFKKWQ